jgi:hypothetical protein
VRTRPESSRDLDRDLVIVTVEDHVNNMLVADRIARQRYDVMRPDAEALLPVVST